VAKEKPYWDGTLVLGLAGRKKVGKDTVADYLVERYADTVKINFSDVIIEEFDKMLAVVDRKVDPANKEPWRPSLQAWGEFRRREDLDYWNRQIEAALEREIEAKRKLILLCGPRSIPEFQMVKIRGGELWRIIRPTLEGEGRDENVTEEIIDQYSKFDRYILNDNTKDKLQVKVDDALKELVENAGSRELNDLSYLNA
jgi:hypothetical protein